MARGRAGALFTAALLSAAAMAVPAQSATATVHAQDFSWVPQQISILAGDSVQWSNDDDVTHSITELSCERAGGAGSPCLFNHDLSPDLTVTVQFPTPGVVEYKCAIHIFFGTINVLSPGGALPDLVLSGLETAPASMTAPLTMRLTAVLKNTSTQTGAGRSDVVFQYRTGGGAWRSIGASLANAVAAGSETIARILWDVTGKIGDFEIRALADGLNQVAESNEENNDSSTLPVSVLLPPGVVTPGIDLTEGL